MGGDGGVIASNRKYMRNAGKANQTADGNSVGNFSTGDGSSEKQQMQELMSLCYLTKAPLQFHKKSPIVTDPLGRLYHKEAVVEALLRRKQQQLSLKKYPDDNHNNYNDINKTDSLGIYIRGLKDLKEVRFELSSGKPVCPVTGVELNGTNPAYLVVVKSSKRSAKVAKNENAVNVLSERAIKEIGKEALQDQFGKWTELIRLAPPPVLMEELKAQIQVQLEQKERTNLKILDEGKVIDDQEKDIRKRKAAVLGIEMGMIKLQKPKQQQTLLVGSSTNPVMESVKQRVQAAVESNEVLSSLFTSTKSSDTTRRAEKLFAFNQA
jgi:Rtf2 RING-finger